MPIPPKILDDLAKRKYRKEIIDVQEADVRGNLDYQQICPKDNITMVAFTDPKTGQKAGLMCPSCELRIMPGTTYASDKVLEAKKKKRMTTIHNAITPSDMVGRRDTDTITIAIREDLYKKNESATETLKGIKYAGKEKKPDPDEELLKAHGMTILESKETNPV